MEYKLGRQGQEWGESSQLGSTEDKSNHAVVIMKVKGSGGIWDMFGSRTSRTYWWVADSDGGI